MSKIETVLKKVRLAQEQFAQFSQEQVDEIFRAAATAANARRIELAQMAVEETGMGVFEDKVLKNHYAAEYIYNRYKNEKTCGVIERDEANGFTRIAAPVGAVITPTRSGKAGSGFFLASENSPSASSCRLRRS